MAGYEADITAVTAKLDDYNEKLSSLDQLQNDLERAEAALREKNTRILSAAVAHYRPDSSEYEQAGGTRRSERKTSRPQRPQDTAATRVLRTLNAGEAPALTSDFRPLTSDL